MSQMWVDADGNPPPADVTLLFAAADNRAGAPSEPTGDQCSDRARVGENLWAFWWPQMGGYHAKAVVRSEPDGCCQDVWVWHNGEFPFSDEHPDPDRGEPRRSPARLHIGDPEDWEEMGRFLGGLPGQGD